MRWSKLLLEESDILRDLIHLFADDSLGHAHKLPDQSTDLFLG